MSRTVRWLCRARRSFRCPQWQHTMELSSAREKCRASERHGFGRATASSLRQVYSQQPSPLPPSPCTRKKLIDRSQETKGLVPCSTTSRCSHLEQRGLFRNSCGEPAPVTHSKILAALNILPSRLMLFGKASVPGTEATLRAVSYCTDKWRRVLGCVYCLQQS